MTRKGSSLNEPSDAETLDAPDAGRARSPSDSSFSRRHYLKGLAAGGASLGLLSVASGQTVATSMNEIFKEYSTVIDMVEAGADNTGRQSIIPTLERYRGDDTLFVFPPGRYYMDRQFRFTGFENVGLVGNDATIVTADYEHFDDQGNDVYRLFRFGTAKTPGKRLRFSGFNIDQSAPETGVRVIDTVVEDELIIKDVWVEGQGDMGSEGPARIAVSDPDGTGIVERFKAPYGDEWIQNTPRNGEVWRGGTGITSNNANHGTLVFKDCELGAFPGTGLYAANGTGQICVEGGRFANSNVAQIRLGGTNSYVRDAEIVVDQRRPHDHDQRGIRLENGRNVRVLDTDITVTATDPCNHAISVQSNCGDAWIQGIDMTVRGENNNHGIVVEGGCGKATICESTIDIATGGGFGIWVRGETNEHGAHVESVDLTDACGTAYGFRDAIRCARGNTEFRVINVTQTNETRRNALVNTADDVLIYRGEFKAHQYPIIDLGTGTWIEEVHAESTGGREAVQLYNGSSDVLIKESTLPGGIQDLGSAGLRTWANAY